MREMAGYALLEQHEVKNRTGLTGLEMRFGHDEGKDPYVYTVALFVTDKKVFVIEAGGLKAEVVKQEAQIAWAIHNFAPK
jgi:hypothetical protein